MNPESLNDAFSTMSIVVRNHDCCRVQNDMFKQSGDNRLADRPNTRAFLRFLNKLQQHVCDGFCMVALADSPL